MTPSALARSAPLNPFQNIGFFLMIAYLFFVHARVLDRLYYLHLPLLIYYLAIASAFLTGGVLRVFSSRVGIFLLALTGWMLAATSTSIWVGGSVEILKEHWTMSLMIYVLIVGLTLTYQQCRQAMHTMAYAVVALALVSFIWGELASGRLVIPFSRFANPNELGQMLVLGLAFLWYAISDPRISTPRRALAVVAAAPMLIAAARTGSRATFIGFGVLVFQLFLNVSLTSKVKILMTAALTVALAALLLPRALKDRYFTLFEPKTAEQLSQQQQRMESEAVGSSWARWELLNRSIRITMQHPLLGVGPGNFMPAEDTLARSEGKRRGMWQLTHNTYTEFSSENGIPALLFYLTAVFSCYQLLSRLKRIGQTCGGDLGADIANAAFSLKLALTSYLVAGCFGNFGYHMYFPLLAGLIVAWYLAVPLAVRLEDTRWRPQPIAFGRRGDPAEKLAPVAHPVWSSPSMAPPALKD